MTPAPPRRPRRWWTVLAQSAICVGLVAMVAWPETHLRALVLPDRGLPWTIEEVQAIKADVRVKGEYPIRGSYDEASRRQGARLYSVPRPPELRQIVNADGSIARRFYIQPEPDVFCRVADVQAMLDCLKARRARRRPPGSRRSSSPAAAGGDQ